jgi:hypothetical protein
MKYQVQVVGEPMQDFTSLNAAIDYATRHVYLPWEDGVKAYAELMEGRSYQYSYGFKSVEIVPILEAS